MCDLLLWFDRNSALNRKWGKTELWTESETNIQWSCRRSSFQQSKQKRLLYLTHITRQSSVFSSLWLDADLPFNGSVCRIEWHLVVKLHVAAEYLSPSISKYEREPVVPSVVINLKRCLICPVWTTVKNMAASVERTRSQCIYTVI